MATKTKPPTKMTGYANWTQMPECQPPGVSVKRAILRGRDELVFDFEYDGWSYEVVLRCTSGSRFEGTFDAVRGARREPIRAECTVYSNDNGFCFVGRWFEDGDEHQWWGEFRKTAHFADEVVERGAK